MFYRILDPSKADFEDFQRSTECNGNAKDTSFRNALIVLLGNKNTLASSIANIKCFYQSISLSYGNSFESFAVGYFDENNNFTVIDKNADAAKIEWKEKHNWKIYDISNNMKQIEEKLNENGSVYDCLVCIMTDRCERGTIFEHDYILKLLDEMKCVKSLAKLLVVNIESDSVLKHHYNELEANKILVNWLQESYSNRTQTIVIPKTPQKDDLSATISLMQQICNKLSGDLALEPESQVEPMGAVFEVGIACARSKEKFERDSGIKLESQTREALHQLTKGIWNHETTETAIEDIRVIIKLLNDNETDLHAKLAVKRKTSENRFQNIIEAMKDLNVTNDRELMQVCWKWWNIWVKICLCYGHYAFDHKKQILVFNIPCGINTIIDGKIKKTEWNELYLITVNEMKEKNDNEKHWQYYRFFDKYSLKSCFTFDENTHFRLESTLPMIKNEVERIREKCRRVPLYKQLVFPRRIKKRLKKCDIDEKAELLEYSKSNGMNNSIIKRLNIGKYIHIYVKFNETGLELQFEPIMEVQVKHTKARFGLAMNAEKFPESLEVVKVLDYDTMLRNARCGNINDKFSV